jgi:hypothetical protein
MPRPGGSRRNDAAAHGYSRVRGGGPLYDPRDQEEEQFPPANWRYETRQVDNRGEYARLTQAKGLDNRQEDADKFADLVERGMSVLEAFSKIHGG